MRIGDSGGDLLERLPSNAILDDGDMGEVDLFESRNAKFSCGGGVVDKESLRRQLQIIYKTV